MEDSSTSNRQKKLIWIDCDPGHDDAFALILASEFLDILGVSTVMGNQSVEKTTLNALKVLQWSGHDYVNVVKGSGVPLVEPLNVCPEIHGDSGLDALLPSSLPDSAVKLKSSAPIDENFITYMYSRLKSANRKVVLVCTAALTNIALLFRVFPDSVRFIEELVLLGGAIGVGNISPAAEWNIMVDPEAAKIVFESGIRLVQIPLEVSHTALVTQDIIDIINQWNTPYSTILVGWLTFFKTTYLEVFGFADPPLHDPLAVAYVIEPEIFETDFIRVDIETTSQLCRGRTVCDVYNRSSKVKNVYVARKVDIKRFWELMVEALKKSNENSPIN